MLVLGFHIGAVLDEGPGQIHMTRQGHPMQWSPLVLVLGCRVGAALDEEPGQIHKIH